MRPGNAGSRTRRAGIALAALAVACAGAFTTGSPADVHASQIPNDRYLQQFSWPTYQLDLPRAWDVSTGSPSVTIAIVDTGVANVPDLAGALLPGIDLVNDDADATDDNGHGTAIASIAAARSNNRVGIAGVCGRCSVLPVKALDASASGHASTVAEGVRWAVAHGARVIDISMNAASDRPDLNAALEDAIAQGATVVIAAGNDGTADPSHGYPASSVPEAIRVAAVGKDKRLASWSNRGSWVDIGSPGWAEVLKHTGGVSLGVDGTSFSAAYVSGLAGLLLSVYPTLTPAEVKALILAGGSRVPGLPVASGRIANAAQTLAAAKRTTLAAAAAATSSQIRSR